ncbi:MAG TPA: TVP38/TMEM64 family protein [Gammaproteobacteria bacterium]|nr:TVP38/TMEM64 family protein [Gammaproteobacteria bacterium]
MRWRLVMRILGICLLLAVVAAGVSQRQHLSVAAIRSWVQGTGAWAPLVFMGLYALLTMAFLPGTILTLAGGALFGPGWGTFYSLTGATLGAAGAFLVARHLAGDWVRRRAGRRLDRLLEGIEQEGWRFVAFVRLVPLFPFNLLNYALGLTRIRFPAFVLASYVFMLPGAFAYAYLGYAGREALAGGPGLLRKGLLALAVLAAVAFLPRLMRRLRRRSDTGDPGA